MFDFDATLPLMAVQFLILAAVLNAIFYKPLSKAIDERDEYIRTTHASAKERLAKAQELTKQYEQQLADARRQSQSIVTNAQAEAQKIASAEMAKAMQESNQLRAQASQEIEQEKQAALQQLEQQVDALSRQLLDKLLGPVGAR